MNEQPKVVTNLSDPADVGQLPKGVWVGDQFGGRSFNDNVAAALERRSNAGWRDVYEGEQCWTLICIER